jgi:outer membrane protein insertion porin family
MSCLVYQSCHITGIRKGEIEDVQKKLSDKTGKIVNQNLLNTSIAIIKKHFNEKGFLNTTVAITQRVDPGDANSIILDVVIDKKTKVMINSVTFEGNKAISDKKLSKYLTKTRKRRWYNLFGSKKFKSDQYQDDKDNLVEQMQDKGYRDAAILSDTVTKHDFQTVDIRIKVHEGPKYYFGNIKWSGNAKYPSDLLNKILRIKKGDVFSEDALKQTPFGPNT